MALDLTNIEDVMKAIAVEKIDLTPPPSSDQDPDGEGEGEFVGGDALGELGEDRSDEAAAPETRGGVRCGKAHRGEVGGRGPRRQRAGLCLWPAAAPGSSCAASTR